MLFIQSVGMIGNSLGYDFDSNSEEQGECCCLFAGIKFRIFLLLELIKSHWGTWLIEFSCICWFFLLQDSEASEAENTEELERRLRERALKSMKRSERGGSDDSKWWCNRAGVCTLLYSVLLGGTVKLSQLFRNIPQIFFFSVSSDMWAFINDFLVGHEMYYKKLKRALFKLWQETSWKWLKSGQQVGVLPENQLCLHLVF